MLSFLSSLRSHLKAQLLSYTQAKLLLLESRLNHLPQNNDDPGSASDRKFTFDCYGEEQCGLPAEQIRSVMEWFSLSLHHSGHNGHSQIIWHDETKAEPWVEDAIRVSLYRGGPIMLYRCGMRTPLPPSGYYWRMLPEHPSMRLYQLEVKED